MPTNDNHRGAVWPDWPTWLDQLARLAPSEVQAVLVRSRPEVWRHYWQQGYSPEHTWQEEARDAPEEPAGGPGAPRRSLYAPA